jgi:hypothetical protein
MYATPIPERSVGFLIYLVSSYSLKICVKHIKNVMFNLQVYIMLCMYG